MAAPAATSTESPALPRRSVTILCMVLITLGFTLTSLFPYVGMMAQHLLRLPTTNESGYYAGFIASSFTFGRFLTAYFWGCAADKIGRKPVVIVGLLAIASCSVAFGLSTSFAMAIASRFVLGLMNGIMPAVRIMTREICGPELVVLGMTYVGGSTGFGIVIGTAVGGLLAMPASNYPNVFSATGIFAQYPFLLPNLFGACLALLVLPLVVFYLPETRTLADVHQPAPTREASPDCDPGESAALSHRTRTTGGRLSYQFLEDDDKSEKMQEQPQTPRNGTIAPARRTDRPESGRAESRTAGAVEHVSLNGREKRRRSRYELLEDNDHDGDDDEENHGYELVANIGAGRSGHSAAPHSILSRDSGGRGDADDGMSDEEMPRPAQIGEEEPGVFGAGGLLSTPNVKLVIFIAAIVQMASIGFEESYPLWAVSTVDVGGLGWTPGHIGKVLAVSGVLLVFFQLGVSPYVIKKIGMVAWQRAGCLLAVAVYLAVPNAKWLSWNDGSLFVVSVLSNVLVIIGISANKLALTVASTSIVPQHQRGKLSGLFMTAESLGRCLGPASFATAFAWSISPSAPGWVDYRLVFCLSAAIMAAVWALSWQTLTLKEVPKPADRLMGESIGGSAAVGGDDDAADDSQTKQALPSSHVAEAESSMAVGSPREPHRGHDPLGAVI